MNKINTDCSTCVFKITEGEEQVSCQLGRLEKYIKREEAQKNGNSYIINRFCETCRQGSITPEQILKEIQTPLCFIVDGLNVKDYWPILKSIKHQTILPSCVFVVFKDNFNKEKYLEYQSLYNSINVPLYFKKFFEDKKFENMVDDVVTSLQKNRQAKFYTPLSAPLKNNNFIEELDQKINHDLEIINAEIYEDFYNSKILCVLHNMLKGSHQEHIINKLKEVKNWAETQKEKETIIIK